MQQDSFMDTQVYLQMSKHTNKYYQLIKVLRHQKQHADMQKAFKQQRLRLKLNHHTDMNSNIIAEIIDHDHSLQMDWKDRNSIERESNLVTIHPHADKLWLLYMKKRCSNKSVLPMQQKLNRMKDQRCIQQIISEQQQKKSSNTSRIKQLITKLKTQCIQLEKLKQNLSDHKKQAKNCEFELTKLKCQYDCQQKLINERSNKFKQQKSKDIMIKNINRQDDQMRNAMISRIKLNKQLDLGFTLQRRRLLNQNKQLINEKKSKAQERYNEIKKRYENKMAEEQQLQLQKHDLEQSNKQIDREIAYFLKQLIKYFEQHSRGIKWMVDKLLLLNQTITADLFPENIYTKDKQFLEMMFKDIIKHTPKNSNINNNIDKRSSMFQSTPNTTPKHTPIMLHNFKTEPDCIYQTTSNYNRTQSQCHHQNKSKRNKTTVHFDIQSAQQKSQQDKRWGRTSRKFNITSPSLKKIYQSTSELIGGLIRHNQWNYESCKIIRSKNKEQQLGDEMSKRQIESRLRQKFMQVRQHVRRNNLKKFIFGSSS